MSLDESSNKSLPLSDFIYIGKSELKFVIEVILSNWTVIGDLGKPKNIFDIQQWITYSEYGIISLPKILRQ